MRLSTTILVRCATNSLSGKETLSGGDERRNPWFVLSSTRLNFWSRRSPIKPVYSWRVSRPLQLFGYTVSRCESGTDGSVLNFQS